ncbi:MAG: GNAT family N-acetyltransferase [Oscillospiraceae bacterium]
MERKSAGLRVRRMTEADLEPLHRLLSDPEVMRYLEPPFSREQTRAFLEPGGADAGAADPGGGRRRRLRGVCDLAPL